MVRPASTSDSMPAATSHFCKSVPMKAELTFFWISGSGPWGATMALITFPGRSGRSGESGSVDMCWIWKIGQPRRRQAAN